MRYLRWLFGLTLYQLVSGIQTCPFNIFQSGFSNDVANIIRDIRSPSYDRETTDTTGICGEYTELIVIEGQYNSTLRLLENSELNVLVGIFNVENDNWIETMTDNEKRIEMVRPKYLEKTIKNDTDGLVVKVFQETFQSLIHQIPKSIIKDEFQHRRIILGSYGIGGTLNVFFATYLYYKYNVTVDMVLNFGAPFMSDRVFDQEVIAPVRKHVGFNNWWNIEVVNIIDASQRDAISESFNRHTRPFVYVNWSALCVAYILPYYDVGIHDASNYKVPMIGFNCE